MNVSPQIFADLSHLHMDASQASSPINQQAMPRIRRETATPSPELAGDSRADGDKALAALYGQALHKTIGSNDEVMIENIPPASTFGQWWAQLGPAMQSEDVADWLAYRKINRSSVQINPESGRISFTVQPSLTSNPLTSDPRAVHTYGPEDASWAAVSGLVMDAGKIVAAGYGSATFRPPLSENSNSAPLWLVKRFYREGEYLSDAAIEQRACELLGNGAFGDLAPDSYLHESRSEEVLDSQRTQLGDTTTRQDVIREVKHLATQLKSGDVGDQDISEHLKKSLVTVALHASYPPDKLNQWHETSLLQYLEEQGWDIPSNQAEVENLSSALHSPQPKSPLHGDFGGALAWPIPLDPTTHRQLRAEIRHGNFGDIDLTPFKNVVEYLMHGSAFDPSELSNPRRMLDRLIQSAKGQKLGKAIQAKFEDKSVLGSVDDWLLAALSVDLAGPQLISKDTMGEHLAGYPLRGVESVGKPASAILKGFVDHLVSTHKASSVEKANVLAYALLAPLAPELLVKDVPQRLTFGSPAWVGFAVAVHRLEAKAPGSTASMSFVQIMQSAEHAPISAQERAAKFEAERVALLSWAAVNGVTGNRAELEEGKQLDIIKAEYSHQLQNQASAAQLLDKAIPSRKEIALAALKKQFGHLGPAFEDKIFSMHSAVDQQNGVSKPLGLPRYSLLDLAMAGMPPGSYFLKSTDPRVTADVVKKVGSLGVEKTFNEQYATAIEEKKRAVHEVIKGLIMQLPSPHRERFADGKINLFQQKSYVIGKGFSDRSPSSIKPELLVKITQGNQTYGYEIDFNNGSIKPTAVLAAQERTDRDANTVTETKEFVAGFEKDYLRIEQPSVRQVLNAYKDPRIDQLASAFTLHLNLDDPEARQIARGQTPWDVERKRSEALEDFFLNLIPFRSAVVNFQKGDWAAGAYDLSLDIFGFLTAGAAAAGKLLKLGNTALSSGAKALQAARIIGMSGVGLLNPLSGAGDLLGAGAKVLSQGGRYLLSRGTGAINGLRSGVLKALGTNNDAVAIGTFRLNHAPLESLAVLHKGKWHPAMPTTGKAYGAPLTDFVPKVQVNADVIRAENYMDSLLKQRFATPGSKGYVNSLAQLKQYDFPVPPKIHRAHTAAGDSVTTGLRRAASATTSGDDYLAAIIKHTARTSGSGGEVMSSVQVKPGQISLPVPTQRIIIGSRSIRSIPRKTPMPLEQLPISCSRTVKG